MKLRLQSQMPFANYPGDITRRFKTVGDGHFTQWQTKLFLRLSWRAGIEFMSEAFLVTSRHQSGACGAADRARHITTRAADAVFRERIYVGREQILAALAPQIGVSKVVSENEKDVWFADRTFRSKAGKQS